MESYVCNGVILPVDETLMSENIRASIKSGGYEGKEASVLQGLLVAAPRVLELGSGLGLISTICAQHPNVQSVVTVEANPKLVPYIRRVHEINGVSKKIEVISGVASAATKLTEMPFYLRRDFWSSSLSPGPYAYTECVPVPVVDLNKIIATHKPDIMIIDIEGGELTIFDGVDLGSIQMIMLEMHQTEIGRAGMKKVFDALSARGFHYEQWHSASAIVTFSRTDRGLVASKAEPVAPRIPPIDDPFLREAEAQNHRILEREPLLNLLPKGGVGVEIGVFTGLFSAAILRIAAPSTFHMVDPWWSLYGEHFPNWGPYTAGGRLKTKVAHDAAVLRTRPFEDSTDIQIHVCCSKEWLDGVEDKSLDWAYIDASSHEAEILEDLRGLGRKLKPDGIICGDDWWTLPGNHHFGVFKAVQRFVDESEFEIFYCSDNAQWAIRRRVW